MKEFLDDIVEELEEAALHLEEVVPHDFIQDLFWKWNFCCLELAIVVDHTLFKKYDFLEKMKESI